MNTFAEKKIVQFTVAGDDHLRSAVLELIRRDPEKYITMMSGPQLDGMYRKVPNRFVLQVQVVGTTRPIRQVLRKYNAHNCFF